MKKFKPGDIVCIRAWDDMEEKFGVDEYGRIRTIAYFVPPMRYLCEEFATITKMYDDSTVELDFCNDEYNDEGWEFSVDMLEMVVEEE